VNLAGRIFLILAATLLLVSLFTIYRRYEQRTQQQREAKYERALASYSHIFQLGETREEVENYLSVREVKYERMCCLDERSAFADLLRIGEEQAPWLCSEQTIYIAFQFAAVEPHDASPAYPSDVLRKINIYRQLSGCL
jgi:hypothetical protein